MYAKNVIKYKEYFSPILAIEATKCYPSKHLLLDWKVIIPMISLQCQTC